MLGYNRPALALGRLFGVASPSRRHRLLVPSALLVLSAVALVVGTPAVAAETGTQQTTTVDNDNVTALYDGEIVDRQERINDVERTPDGGFIALKIAGGEAVETTILRLDASGEVTKQETIAGGLESLRRVDDGAYAAVGARDGEEVLVARIRGDGTVEWTDTYGGDGVDIATDVASAPDGDAYVLASTESSDAETSDLWVLRIDPEGAVVWDRRVTHEEWTAFPMGERLEDGSLVASIRTGQSMDGTVDGDQNVSVVRITPDGEVLWRTLVTGEGTVGKDGVFEVIPAHGDGVLMAGTSNSGNERGQSDVWAVRVGADGEVLWQRDYETDTEDVANTAIRTADGYLLVGVSGSDDRADRGRLVAIDADGSQRFAATYDRGADLDFDLDTWLVGGDWTADGKLALGGAAINSDADGPRTQAWVADFRGSIPPVEPGPSTWETQHPNVEESSGSESGGTDGDESTGGEQNDAAVPGADGGTAIEDVDSGMDLVLYAAAAFSTGLLFAPYGIRRFRRR